METKFLFEFTRTHLPGVGGNVHVLTINDPLVRGGGQGYRQKQKYQSVHPEADLHNWMGEEHRVRLLILYVSCGADKTVRMGYFSYNSSTSCQDTEASLFTSAARYQM